MKWYGEPIEDLKIKIPKSLPTYTEDTDIQKLLKAIEDKKTHKKTIIRDMLLVETALQSGLRRAELANLTPSDIHNDFLMVCHGKNNKDRMVPKLYLRCKNYPVTYWGGKDCAP